MNQAAVLSIVALAASTLLVVQHKARLWPALALLASGLEVLIALGYIRLSVAGVSLGLILGGALVVAGVMLWLKVAGKLQISAATLIIGVGLIQVLGRLL